MCDPKHTNHCCCRGLKGSMQPRILLLILQKPMYGYELLDSLAREGNPGAPDPGGLYRMLRAMEQEGLLSSSWETNEGGPARRMYQITQAGEVQLKNWAHTLRDTRDWLEQFLSAYENLVEEARHNPLNEQIGKRR